MHSPSGALEECYVTEIDQGENLSLPRHVFCPNQGQQASLRSGQLNGSRLRIQKESIDFLRSQNGAPTHGPPHLKNPSLATVARKIFFGKTTQSSDREIQSLTTGLLPGPVARGIALVLHYT